jgi:hypothetical protein
MTPLVLAATVQATPVFLDRDTTVVQIVELTAKAAKERAGLPAGTVTSLPVSARRSTTGPSGKPVLPAGCPFEVACFASAADPSVISPPIPGGERCLQHRSTPTVEKRPRFR